jgi:hypothetical protein
MSTSYSNEMTRPILFSSRNDRRIDMKKIIMRLKKMAQVQNSNLKSSSFLNGGFYYPSEEKNHRDQYESFRLKVMMRGNRS